MFARLLTGLSVLVFACGPVEVPVGECVTTCGMQISGTSDCDAANAAEARVIKAFDRRVSGWTPDRTCAAFYFAKLQIRAEESWPDGYGRQVAGLAYCSANPLLIIGTDNWSTNAFAHESAHLMECLVDRAFPAVDHSNWGERGILTALGEANR